jgi:hypothetical protein
MANKKNNSNSKKRKYDEGILNGENSNKKNTKKVNIISKKISTKKDKKKIKEKYPFLYMVNKFIKSLHPDHNDGKKFYYEEQLENLKNKCEEGLLLNDEKKTIYDLHLSILKPRDLYFYVLTLYSLAGHMDGLPLTNINTLCKVGKERWHVQFENGLPFHHSQKLRESGVDLHFQPGSFWHEKFQRNIPKAFKHWADVYCTRKREPYELRMPFYLEMYVIKKEINRIRRFFTKQIEKSRKSTPIFTSVQKIKMEKNLQNLLLQKRFFFEKETKKDNFIKALHKFHEIMDNK